MGFIWMLLVIFLALERIFSNQTSFGCFGFPKDTNIPEPRPLILFLAFFMLSNE